MNICFVGGGNMADALIGGLIANGASPSSLVAVDILPQARARLTSQHGVRAMARITEGVQGANCIVLAVKPQQLHEVAVELAPLLSRQLVISIAAGIASADLSRWLGGYGRIVRVMPNTPALVRRGVSGLYAMPQVDAGERRDAETILGAVGATLWVDSDEQIDAVTAVSGSGPAYVFYFIEAMREAAARLGFDEAQTRTLVHGTFAGAVELANASAEDVATLRARVTSKGGTTQAAIETMQAREVKERVVEGVLAAMRRARELGIELGRETGK